jgi:hypothetical protein
LGARIFNNTKLTNYGFVDDTPSLDLRQLRKRGFLIDGKVTPGYLPLGGRNRI